jgi:O-antigen ligase
MPAISLIYTILIEETAFKDMYLQNAFNTIGYLGILFCLLKILWNKYNIPKVHKTITEILRDNGLIIFLGLMLFWTILSTVFAEDRHLAFWGYIIRGEGLYTILGYAGFFVIALNIKLRKHIKMLLNIFVASGSVIAAICLINNEALMDFLTMESYKGYFSNQNHYGYFICIAVMSAILLAVTDEKPHSKKLASIFILHVLELGLLLNALIQAHSLGPLLAIVVTLTLLFLLTIFVDKSKLKRVLFILLFAIFIMGLSSLFTWDLSTDFHVFSSSLEDIYEDNDQYNADSFGSGRGELWINTIELIKEKPLLGQGLDNLTIPTSNGGYKFYRAHCELLQTAACQGIPAALFYISGLSCLLAMFIYYFKRIDIFTLCMYCIVGAYLISSIVGISKYSTSPYYYMLLGLCYSNIKALSKS